MEEKERLIGFHGVVYPWNAMVYNIHRLTSHITTMTNVGYLNFTNLGFLKLFQ